VKKRIGDILLVIIILMVLGLIIFFSTIQRAGKYSVPAFNPAVLPVKASRVPAIRTPAPEPAAAKPQTGILERKIRSGNKGYMVRDRQDVYFGIETTVREEVDVN